MEVRNSIMYTIYSTTKYLDKIHKVYLKITEHVVSELQYYFKHFKRNLNYILNHVANNTQFLKKITEMKKELRISKLKIYREN